VAVQNLDDVCEEHEERVRHVSKLGEETVRPIGCGSVSGA
jgi:hypothetical protein